MGEVEENFFKERNYPVRLILALVATVALGAVIAPQERYTLRYLAWDGEGPFTVFVRTNELTEPVAVLNTTSNKIAISNLLYDVDYFLSVTNAGGVSTNFKWPQPMTNYVGTIRQASASSQGPWISIPGSEIILTNPVINAQYWRLLSWKSNNIDVHIFPE